MKSIITLTCLLFAVTFFAGCESNPGLNPNQKPTAENGAVHGAPTQPSTSNQ